MDDQYCTSVRKRSIPFSSMWRARAVGASAETPTVGLGSRPGCNAEVHMSTGVIMPALDPS